MWLKPPDETSHGKLLCGHKSGCSITRGTVLTHLSFLGMSRLFMAFILELCFGLHLKSCTLVSIIWIMFGEVLNLEIFTGKTSYRHLNILYCFEMFLNHIQISITSIYLLLEMPEYSSQIVLSGIK